MDDFFELFNTVPRLNGQTYIEHVTEGFVRTLELVVVTTVSLTNTFYPFILPTFVKQRLIKIVSNFERKDE